MNTRLPSKRRRDENGSLSDSNDSKKSRRKITLFNPHDLREALLPTLDVILESKLPKPFRMDISTIKRNLSSESYSDARDYVEDVWSVFENLWLSKTKCERYNELADKFQLEIDPVMQSLGFCCGKNFRFAPPKLCCSFKEECTITIDEHYFTYQTSHNICERCFTGIPGDTVTLAETSSSQIQIRKDQFVKAQNNVWTPEPLIDCQDCGRRQHEICVLYSKKIWRKGFVCDVCLEVKGAKRDENRFRAKDLPVTKLDSHIEARVNNFFKMNKFDGGRVHIRMSLNANQKVTVKPAMRNLFVESREMSALFPYRSKAIFAFQEIDNVDVCFFGMYVQEYGSECPNPNTRRVYVEFLDSVNFFQPKRFRTAVYHEILLGYMDFAKQLGYTWLHIWACPPPQGENYIFYNHPADQKIPDPLRLQRWYTKIFRKGKNGHIIVDYKNILQQTKEDNVAAPARLPYFDEDYWPSFFENTLEEIGKKSGTARSKQKRKRKAIKQSKSSSATHINRQKSVLRSKLFSKMEEVSENFYSVQLHSAESAASLPPIRDPDSLMDSSIMYGHSAFFDFARDNNYEFSSLRRAKFSTMCILYELHNEELKSESYVCNICDSHTDTWYHCTVCEDYDLCVDCKEEAGHAHEMHRMGLAPLANIATTQQSDNQTSPIGIIDLDTSDDDTTSQSGLQADLMDSQNEIPPSVSPENSETDEQSVLAIPARHAFKCTDRNCQTRSCQIIKCFSRHVKSCPKTNGSCRICRTLDTLLSSHSDSCRNVNCSYSFCRNSRAETMRQQQLQREKDHIDNVINMATTLQKVSVKILDDRKAWTNQQFLLSIAYDLTKAQMQLQKMLAANYSDCVCQTTNVRTTDSTALNKSASTQSSQIVDSMELA